MELTLLTPAALEKKMNSETESILAVYMGLTMVQRHQLAFKSIFSLIAIMNEMFRQVKKAAIYSKSHFFLFLPHEMEKKSVFSAGFLLLLLFPREFAPPHAV